MVAVLLGQYRKNCYWYDREAERFTGEFSPIKIKVTGFDWPSWLSFMHGNSNLKGEIEIADYPIWTEGHDASLAFSHDYNSLNYNAYIHVLESYTVIDDAKVAHHRFGDIYGLWFASYPTVPEYIMVQVTEDREVSDGPVIGGDRMGYVAESLEEAKTMWELEMGKNP